ncbi:exosortase family protein XrtF [Nonlabens sp. Hel1_33_55]|uniref:exosortase family protein XrtF n=1 Tax=Nonlabens sp. Hel1_33_55 TaxID=1336802 RepID=UPI000875D4BE|nr:exosortase family protein XrtF [Nonlabens sp. Hel1_33_55]SCY25205.1 exosortase family protein XrtF [Nonlabens sp. Hel1_33_55]
MDRLKPYYPVFKFVIIFGALYLLLSLAYYGYLQLEYQDYNYPDPITAGVSRQTQTILQWLGYDAQIYNASSHPSVMLYINDQIVYRVIEGCNAVSVMLLFAAFVIAFAKAYKKTILFLLIGFVFIYLVNLTRLVSLALVFQNLPEFREVAHDIAFPAVIYGSVILLWIYWIRKPKTS